MTLLNSNGTARKSLASQLDRFDQMLDGLSEALNDSVAAAVKEAVATAVREAVQAVLTELLTNPALAAKLQGLAGAAPRQATPPPTWPQRVAPLVRWLAATFQTLGAQRRVAVQWTRQCGSGLVACAAGLCTTVRGVARRVRRLGAPLLLALLCGLTLGAAAFAAGPGLAAVLSGGSGFAAALLAQVGFWLRRALAACDGGRAGPAARTIA